MPLLTVLRTPGEGETQMRHKTKTLVGLVVAVVSLAIVLAILVADRVAKFGN